MLRQLTIQLRKRQLVDIYGNPVYYTGVNPLSLSATIGSISNPWMDFTDYVQGLEKIELEWTTERTDDGRPLVGKYSPAKGVSGLLSFEREAYEFLKDWLVNDVAAVLNQVEVQITDTNCGRYIGYFIKSDHLEWCEFNSTCVFNLNLKQIEDFTHCIQRTTIADNWQGWFQNEPEDLTTGTPKKHPRFSYCVEKRPNFGLVLLWELSILAAIQLSLLYTLIYPILLAIYVIRVAISALITAINAVIDLINGVIDAVNTLLPGSPLSHIPHIPGDDPGTAPILPTEVFLNWANVMLESAGCGREHPAPLIRDYILNVCNKCGIEVSATTADVFFAPVISQTHSDGDLYTVPNPHFNACYLFPQVKKGVRRFRSINVFTGESSPDTSTYYQPENAPVLSLADFLDQLSKHYNQQWRIIVEGGIPQLYIKRKDWYTDQPPLYDFSFGGADRSKIVEGVCYQQLDITLPASCGYLYGDDPADKCGVEAGDFYNGIQHLSFGFTVINPIFNGILNKESDFAAAHFNCDGSTTNYIYDALQVCYSINAINPLATIILGELGTKINNYADYKLLLQTETTSKPKILIWDGDTDNPESPNYLNATAVRDRINIDGTVYTIGKSGYAGTVSGITTPDINTRYPTEVPDTGGTTFVPSSVPSPVAWVDNHAPKVDVIGQFPTFGTPAGVYAVTTPLGATVLATPAILVNYPAYFEPHYLDTMWDWFHWIDDPLRYPRLNKKWSLKIPLCCDDVTLLNLTENVNGQKLLNTVILDTAFYNIGVITSIKVNYDNGDDKGTGQTIELSGIV